jgi:hypothetical protein
MHGGSPPRQADSGGWLARQKPSGIRP